MIAKNKLHRITIHGFRHSHASILFEAGASIKEVQARLGHKEIQTTMNIYMSRKPQKKKLPKHLKSTWNYEKFI
ncbi:tyrosine-type recombinase/integrase [Bacillus haynesii]|uniref:tyrosine-type recombinase/integrase n=1 Tax=Bacillus haynesii TaxID=1925021 RepID=UPI002282EA72